MNGRNDDINVQVVISMTKGIYKITNDRTGEVYVGQAKNLESRWNRHLRELSQGKHHNAGMQKDHDRGDTFSFEILEELPDATKADLSNKESQYVKKYNSFREGYNQTPGGHMDQFKGRYEFGGGRLPIEKYKPTEAYASKELDSDFPIKFCPNCGFEVKKPTIRCIKCGEPFFDFDKEIDNTFVQTENISNVKTKHIDEAGVSFDFPEYYLLASIPDNTPDCIIALAKDDGTCDVMVEVSSSKDRIKYTGNNFIPSYTKYISDLGYYDIKTISGFDSKKTCFQSYIDHELGTIKQTTYFDFRFKKDIRITFNTLKNVDYDCMEDLKIIEKSINYKKSSIIDAIKNKITYKTKTIIGFISLLLTLLFIPFINLVNYSIIEFPIFYMPTVLPAIFLLLPSEKFKDNKILSIISMLIVIPFLIFNLNDLTYMASTLFDPTSYATFLDYIPYEIWVVIYCLYNLFCAIILYIPTSSEKNETFKQSLFSSFDSKSGSYKLAKTKIVSLFVFILFGLICVVSFWEAIAYNNFSGRIIGVMIAFVIGGLIFSLPVLIIGTMIKKSRKTTGKEEVALMEYLLYYNEDGQRRLSKTKIITWIVFLIVVIGNLINPINDIPLISLVITAIILGLIVAIPTYAVCLIISKIIRKIK